MTARSERSCIPVSHQWRQRRPEEPWRERSDLNRCEDASAEISSSIHQLLRVRDRIEGHACSAAPRAPHAKSEIDDTAVSSSPPGPLPAMSTAATPADRMRAPRFIIRRWWRGRPPLSSVSNDTESGISNSVDDDAAASGVGRRRS